jgi:uncharacterized membrane protein
MHLVLTPNRSLSPAGFRRLMIGMLLICVLMSARFLLFSTQAWPIALFLMADVLLLYIAFRASYASAREREELTLTPSGLEVLQWQRGGVRRRLFDPYWVRVVLDEINEFENRLQLVMRGDSLVIGAFLSPHERVELRDELNRHLAVFRR